MMQSRTPFGSIRERDSGRWQLRYRINGRQTSEPFDSYAEAFVRSQQLRVLGVEGRQAKELGRTMPICAVAQHWVQYAGPAESTRRTDESHLRNHILPVFGLLPIAEIRRHEVERWIKDLDCEAATKQRILSVLRRICSFGYDREWIDRNPTYGVSVDGANSRRFRHLPSIDQIEQLRLAIDPRYGPLVDLMAYGGCSISEVAAIRVGDLDFDRRILHVRAARKLVADGPPVISEVMKTSTRDREVPVIPERVWDRLGPINGSDTSALIAPAPKGGLLHPSNFRTRVFQPAVREVLGDAREVQTHGLRHFACSLWLAAGMDDTEVAQWAGHASIQMVSRTYSHPIPRTDPDLEKSTFEEINAARAYPRLGRSSEGQVSRAAS